MAAVKAPPDSSAVPPQDGILSPVKVLFISPSPPLLIWRDPRLLDYEMMPDGPTPLLAAPLALKPPLVRTPGAPATPSLVAPSGEVGYTAYDDISWWNFCRIEIASV